jgi:hypothetical protein
MPIASVMIKYAEINDSLDFAGEAMMEGFSLGSSICGLHRARSISQGEGHAMPRTNCLAGQCPGAS